MSVGEGGRGRRRNGRTSGRAAHQMVCLSQGQFFGFTDILYCIFFFDLDLEMGILHMFQNIFKILSPLKYCPYPILSPLTLSSVFLTSSVFSYFFCISFYRWRRVRQNTAFIQDLQFSEPSNDANLGYKTTLRVLPFRVSGYSEDTLFLDPSFYLGSMP